MRNDVSEVLTISTGLPLFTSENVLRTEPPTVSNVVLSSKRTSIFFPVRVTGELVLSLQAYRHVLAQLAAAIERILINSLLLYV